MPMIVQACIVVVTIAVVVMAFMAVRLMIRLDALTDTVESGFLHMREAIDGFRKTSDKLDGVLGVVDQIAQSVRTGTDRVEGVVDQASSVASTFLDEVERPVHEAVAVMRGIQAGTRALMQRWGNGRHSHDHI